MQAAFAPGKVLQGRYILERELGRGAMGQVYLGRDSRLERPVAIKVILPPERGRQDPDPASRMRQRFADEARLGASLTHPAIATVFDYGFHDDNPFTVFEYIPGETLRELLRAAGPTTARRGSADHRAAGPGARLRPRPTHHPSRPEAGERPSDRAGAIQGAGFGSGPRVPPRERLVGIRRHAGLLPTRAGGGIALRRPVRPVRPRPHHLRVAHRPTTVRGPRLARTTRQACPGTPTLASIVRRRAARPRSRRPDASLKEGPEPPLRLLH